MQTIKDFFKRYWVVSAVAAVLLFSFGIFLFTEDGTYGVTGIETLQQEGLGFWIACIIFSGLAIYTIRVGLKAYQKEQEATTLNKYFILAAIFFCIAFGKGCTDKANGAITTADGRPTPAAIDTTRQAVDPTLR